MEIISNMIEAHVFREIGEGIEFLLLKRRVEGKYPGLWQMVNGKPEEGEKSYETALREVKEETGMIPKRMWVVPNVNSFYSHETDKIILLPVFAALVEDKIEPIISEEHSEYCWCKPEEAKKKLVWEGQRKSIDMILQYFVMEIDNWEFVEIKF